MKEDEQLDYDFETKLSLAIAAVIEERRTSKYTVGDIKDAIKPIITERDTAIRTDEIQHKYTLPLDYYATREFKAGYHAALDAVDEANKLRIAELEAIKRKDGGMSRYLITSELGDRRFKREEDATDYQIKILSQAGVRSEIHDTWEVCENCGEKCGAELPYGTDCKRKDGE